MKNLLKRFFDGAIKEEVKLTDEELSNLGEEIQNWQRSQFWNIIINPFMEDCSLNEMENLFNNGINYNNEEKNAIIRMVRLTKAFKDEIRVWQDRCNQAKQRLLNGDTRKAPRGGRNG